MPYPSEYINRELSWLEFNQRVLEEAMDPTNPLLERVKYLAITGSNLDEFFMVRVGGLAILESTGSNKLDIAGLTVNQQLDVIRERVLKLNQQQAKCIQQLEIELASKGITRIGAADCTSTQREFLAEKFSEEVESVISPIAVGLDSPFPLLANAGVCLCVRIKHDVKQTLATESGNLDNTVDSDRFVVIPCTRSLERFVSVPSETGFNYVLLEDMVGLFLDQLLEGQTVLDWTPFRITRNADIAMDDSADDLLVEMTELLQKRIVSDCIRLELAHSASQETTTFLQSALKISDNETYRIDAPLAFSDYFSLSSLQGFQTLKDPPWPSQRSPDFDTGQGFFEIIAAGDRLLVHPYQSYDPVVNFLRAAAEDEQVLAIKQTLYRTARDSAIIDALLTAAENGKHVSVIVELKARFDEARNIRGAQRLEQAGVDVIYGVSGLKTHAKICIVVRREERGIQRYMHFGTGNYNESTASLYSDISYFTNNAQLGTDAVHFFNAITGLSVPQNLELLSASPIDCRDTFEELIQVEAENAKKGGTGEISAKLNSLVDKQMIDALYEASKAGVKIKLNVRGICALKPGIPGLSENIEVTSIVDRMLEHARIFRFHHGGDELVYLSSADWMTRNLDRRVELLVPIVDDTCKQRVLRILEVYFSDNVKSRVLQTDGTYQRKTSTSTNRVRSQSTLYKEAREMYAAFTNPKATVFKAHRGETA